MEIVKNLGLEAYRLRLLRGLDEQLQALGFSSLAGVDEAGRGCLAGPVVAAAVIMRPDHLMPGVDDSKQLTSVQREGLSRAIRSTAVATSVAAVSPAIIDDINILEATRRAMSLALDGLQPQPDCAVIDAVKLPKRQYRSLSLVRGDVVSYSVACASILAKVERDRLMLDLDREYPHYGFVRNKGYGAAEHREALMKYGPSPVHRLTFRSVVPRVLEVAR